MPVSAIRVIPARAWDMDGRLDLTRTVGVLARGPFDRTIRIAGQTAWLAFHTPDGPATLNLRLAPSSEPADPARHRVEARAWGPGAESALASAPALLGAADDWSGFDEPAFAATLPALVRDARRRHPALRLPATGRMIDGLIPAILEQKVTVIEARRAYAFLIRKFGSAAPGIDGESGVPADLMAAPTPEQWAAIPSWVWHQAGVGPQRSATVMRILRSASGLERLASLPAPEAGAKLQSIPGVGPWTAAEVTQRTHADPDSVSVGDFHLAGYVGWALIGRPVDDAQMLDLLEPWRGHRQRVVRMLQLSGFRKPAFGPRITIQDHRRH